MIFKDLYPQAPLDEVVQLFKLRHFIIPNHITVHPKPYTPRPEQCITFYARGHELAEVFSSPGKIRKPRSVLSGQYTGLVNRYSGSAEFLMIIVVFKPGTLHRITGIPFYELVYQHIDLEDVFPKEARMVNDRLNSTDDYDEMLSIIQQFLIFLLNNSKKDFRPTDTVFNIIGTSSTKYSLDWLSNQACLSPRQFERTAHNYLGVSPQLFARIKRFDESYRMRLASPTLDWLSVAVACGYHDYQHLVRDYKQFAYTTPNNLFAAESKVIERALGLNK